MNFPQKNSVVAGDVGGYDAADDLGEGVFEEGDAGVRPAKANVERCFGFRCLISLREVDGKGLLVFLQDVDAEGAVLFEKRQEMAALVNADKNEERVEGDGCEGIGGHAVGLAGSARGGDDGDAGCELAERVAEVSCGKRSGGHVRSF